MKATMLDLRRRMKDVLAALDRKETVTILHRGREKGVIHPVGQKGKKRKSFKDLPAFGMWRDREDMKDVEGWLRKRRERNFRAI